MCFPVVEIVKRRERERGNRQTGVKHHNVPKKKGRVKMKQFVKCTTLPTVDWLFGTKGQRLWRAVQHLNKDELVEGSRCSLRGNAIQFPNDTKALDIVYKSCMFLVKIVYLNKLRCEPQKLHLPNTKRHFKCKIAY